MQIIKTENIDYFYYNKFLALKNISLDIKQGEIFAIIGSNGSGKSTLLKIIAGLLFAKNGKIFFQDIELSEKLFRDKNFLTYFRQKVGFVFQDPDIQLFCPTVLDELLFGPIQIGLDKSEAISRVDGIIEMLNIEHLKNRPSYMLSGGEKKKVAIGSVLTMNPDVLLFDEPTNGLDPKTQVFLLELLFELNKNGKTIVIATHDLSLVYELQAKTAVISEEHKIEKIDSGDKILSDEDLLLKVNLIHEHIHYHGNFTHRHLHSHHSFHKH